MGAGGQGVRGHSGHRRNTSLRLGTDAAWQRDAQWDREEREVRHGDRTEERREGRVGEGGGRNGGGDWRRRVQIRLHVVWPQKPRRKIIWNTEPLKEGPEEDMGRGFTMAVYGGTAGARTATGRGGGRRGVRGSVEHWEAGILEAPRHLRKGRKSGINICWGRVEQGAEGREMTQGECREDRGGLLEG